MPATKDEIALTFMGLTVRYGFKRTAVEDVARALRISKKTIYEYFPSKDAMLEYALELAALQQRRRVESLLTETTALGRSLEITRIALSDARAGFAANPGLDLAEPPELQTRVNDRVYGPMIRDLLEQGIAAGEFEVADVDADEQVRPGDRHGGGAADPRRPGEPSRGGDRPGDPPADHGRERGGSASAVAAPAKKNKKKAKRK